MTTPFQKGSGKFANSKQMRAFENLQDDMDDVQTLKTYDALIISQDDNNYDQYKVDIFEDGFGNPPTQQDTDAICPSNNQFFVKWQPCRVCIGRSGFAMIIRGNFLSYMIPKNDYPPNNQGTYYPNQLRGYPCGINYSAENLGATSWPRNNYNGQDTSIAINLQVPPASLGSPPYTFLAPTTFRSFANSSFIPWINYDVPIRMPKSLAIPQNNTYSPPIQAFPAIDEWQAVGFLVWSETIPRGGGIGKSLQILDDWGGFGWDFPVFT